MQKNLSTKSAPTANRPWKTMTRVAATAAALFGILLLGQLSSTVAADGTKAPNAPPSKTLAPTPQDTVTTAPYYSKLQWTNGGGAVGYAVYLSTTTTLTDVERLGYTTETCFKPRLAPNRTYYWRVDALNLLGTATGDVWTFTTDESLLPGNSVNPCPSPRGPNIALQTSPH